VESHTKENAMAGELRHQFQVGEHVYRKWRWTGREDYWYEPWKVMKVTAKQVRVEIMPWQINDDEYLKWRDYLVLSRRALERSGFDICRPIGGVFYTDLPEEYRRGTIGYLMDKKPREVLGLPDFFTVEQLQAAYRQKARELHPDRGGTHEAFLAVQEAYNHLSKAPDIGKIMKFAKETG
jgi:hypothetical protein